MPKVVFGNKNFISLFNIDVHDHIFTLLKPVRIKSFILIHFSIAIMLKTFVPIDNCMAALNFATDKEADNFRKIVLDKVNTINQKHQGNNFFISFT